MDAARALQMSGEEWSGAGWSPEFSRRALAALVRKARRVSVIFSIGSINCVQEEGRRRGNCELDDETVFGSIRFTFLP